MKPPSKPISSPGRTDKFPPPLMRFLRSNVGSRSRGRSRSSPLFIMRKKTASAAAETQEPTSPKVTCIGQVRVRRTKQPARPGRHPSIRRRRRCRWFRSAFFCRCFAAKLKPVPFRPAWRKCVPFLCRRKVETSEDSFKSQAYRDARDDERDEEDEGRGCHFKEGKEEEEEVDYEELARVSISSACSPPKNALLLTRCRSAPYRSSSSSLTGRFWGSEEKWDENRAPNIGSLDPPSEPEPAPRDSAAESIDNPEEESVQNPRILKEFEGSTEHRNPELSAIEAWETGDGGAPVVRPLILTRCKSAPARRFGKVGPI